MFVKAVILLNASNELLSQISWRRAVTLVLNGDAHIVEAHNSRHIRSQNVTLPEPKVVQLTRYVYVKWVENKTPLKPSKAHVLARDQHVCAYCGEYAHTVDHVQPRSRGGLNTWENLVAACTPCNNRKADKTLGEAGLKLAWEPVSVSFSSLRQKYGSKKW